MAYKIIQASFPNTGSTFLVNILHGLLDPHTDVTCTNMHEAFRSGLLKKHLIIKTHNVKIDKWVERSSRMLKKEAYELYFVCTERGNKRILNQKHQRYNILRIPYEELLETCSLPLEDIITNIQHKLLVFLPDIYASDIIENKEIALKRVLDIKL